jgi:hypothetical protein
MEEDRKLTKSPLRRKIGRQRKIQPPRLTRELSDVTVESIREAKNAIAERKHRLITSTSLEDFTETMYILYLMETQEGFVEAIKTYGETSLRRESNSKIKKFIQHKIDFANNK